MKLRKNEYGDCNIIGRRVEQLRKEKGIKQKDFIAKLQLEGLDMNPTSYSKLEGQIRIATDKEVLAMAEVLKEPTTYSVQFKQPTNGNIYNDKSKN